MAKIRVEHANNLKQRWEWEGGEPNTNKNFKIKRALAWTFYLEEIQDLLGLKPEGKEVTHLRFFLGDQGTQTSLMAVPSTGKPVFNPDNSLDVVRYEDDIDHWNDYEVVMADSVTSPGNLQRAERGNAMAIGIKEVPKVAPPLPTTTAIEWASNWRSKFAVDPTPRNSSEEEIKAWAFYSGDIHQLINTWKPEVRFIRFYLASKKKTGEDDTIIMVGTRADGSDIITTPSVKMINNQAYDFAEPCPPLCCCS